MAYGAVKLIGVGNGFAAPDNSCASVMAAANSAGLFQDGRVATQCSADPVLVATYVGFSLPDGSFAVYQVESIYATPAPSGGGGSSGGSGGTSGGSGGSSGGSTGGSGGTGSGGSTGGTSGGGTGTGSTSCVSTSCTVTVQLNSPLLNMTAADSLSVAAAIVGCWAVGLAIRMIIRTINDGDSSIKESE